MFRLTLLYIDIFLSFIVIYLLTFDMSLVILKLALGKTIIFKWRIKMKLIGTKSIAEHLSKLLKIAYGVVLVSFFISLVLGTISLWRSGSLGLDNHISIKTPGINFDFSNLSYKANTKYMNFLFLSAVPSYLISAFIIKELSRILDTLVKEEPFVYANIVSIKKIAKALILGSILYTIIHFIIGLIITSVVQTPGVKLTTNLSIDGSMLFMGILLYLLAEVFKLGLIIKEEQDLTV